MADILLVGEGLLREENEVGRNALALGSALQEKGHRVAVISLLSEQEAGNNSSFARRLRTVDVQIADETASCSIFEGKHSKSQLSLFALGFSPRDRGHAAAYLAAAVPILCAIAQLKPTMLIGWGEASAPAVREAQAETKLFFLPDGDWTAPLNHSERLALDPRSADLELAEYSLAGLGAISADALVLPTPSAKRRFLQSGNFNYRASDLPIFSLRFGCDEPLTQSSDSIASQWNFSERSTDPRALDKKASARKAGLSLGAKTLLIATTPLVRSQESVALCEALPEIARLDIALAIPGGGDSGLEDVARQCSLENPGKVVFLATHNLFQDMWLLTAADATVILNDTPSTARTAGLLMFNRILPIVSESHTYADYIIDVDPTSKTGNGLLYSSKSPNGILAALSRLRLMRDDYPLWNELQMGLISASPRWADTAECILQIKSSISPTS